MRLLVSGSRSWTDTSLIREWLIHLKPDVVIHGGASGADSLCGQVAEEMGLIVQVYKAEWKRFGLKAGKIRNQKMLDDGNPDMLCAFWDGESRGTYDMLMRADTYKIDRHLPNFRIIIVREGMHP